MADQTTHAAAAAVGGGAVGAAAVVICSWLLDLNGITLPAEVVVAMTTIANAVITVFASLILKKLGVASS